MAMVTDMHKLVKMLIINGVECPVLNRMSTLPTEVQETSLKKKREGCESHRMGRRVLWATAFWLWSVTAVSICTHWSFQNRRI